MAVRHWVYSRRRRKQHSKPKRPVKDIDYGFVGDIDGNRTHALLIPCLKAKLSPVFCAFNHMMVREILKIMLNTIGLRILAIA